MRITSRNRPGGRRAVLHGAAFVIGLVGLLTIAPLDPAAGQTGAPEPEPATAAASLMSPVERVRALVQPSIVYLETEFSARVYDAYNRLYVGDGPYVLTTACSGFFVNPDGYIVTAGHCADVDRDVREDLVAQAAEWAFRNGYYASDTLTLGDIRRFAEEDYELEARSKERGRVDRSVTVWFGISVDGLASGRRLPARILDVRSFEEGDVALLKVEAHDMPSLALDTAAGTAVGTGVVTVGYAAVVDDVTDVSYDPSFKEGSISSTRTVGDGLIEVYETSSALTGGMSGGPTVNLEGRVIGLNSFRVRGESQPFNFVFPATIVSEVLQAKGVANEIGEVNETYRAGIAAYDAGDGPAAIAKLTEVLALVPNHELAEEYLAKAHRLPVPAPAPGAQPPVPDSLPPGPVTTTTPLADTKQTEPSLLWVGLTIPAVLVLAGGVGWGLRRRRSAVDAGLRPGAPPQTGPNGVAEQVAALAALHAQGVVSSDEFEQAKSRLLAGSVH